MSSSGSRSASGSRANLRSWRRGCGMRSPGSSSTSSPYTSRSRSIVRGPQRSPSRTRPSSRSMRSITSRSSRGESDVSSASAPFRNVRLVDDSHGLRLAQLRELEHLDPGLGAEQLDRPQDRDLLRAEVRAQADVGLRHARERSTITRRVLDRRVEHDVRLAHADANALRRPGNRSRTPSTTAPASASSSSRSGPAKTSRTSSARCR